jgi:hypothetical protein
VVFLWGFGGGGGSPPGVGWVWGGPTEGGGRRDLSTHLEVSWPGPLARPYDQNLPSHLATGADGELT